MMGSMGPMGMGPMGSMANYNPGMPSGFTSPDARFRVEGLNPYMMSSLKNIVASMFFFHSLENGGMKPI